MGCLSNRGFGRIQVVEGSVKSEQYMSAIKQRLRPQTTVNGILKIMDFNARQYPLPYVVGF